MDEVVAWNVQRMPRIRVLGLRLWHLLKWVAVIAVNIPLAIGGDSAGDIPRRRPIRPRLPHDVREPLDVEPPLVGGDVTWLGNRWTNKHPITLYADKAEIAPLTKVIDVPLEHLRLLRAVPSGRTGRDPRAPWSLDVADAREPRASITITGEWISLAWLGHLAGWPEPGSAGTPTLPGVRGSH
ncbi:hypothetical protein GCM10009710_37370 [Aeromicrobium alkaliterrae]|uniref:Uncharacterized protein n=2 Tax=Aeromicrobium alkaliterrae TaxID=302168 RepID=A0ABN2KFK8_9ACTN